MTQISTSPLLPGLSNAVVQKLAGEWTDLGLWRDVRWLAVEFMNAKESDKVLRWHHLVMAVGNFKRQGGRRLQPTCLAERSHTVETAAVLDVFEIPGTVPAVKVTESDRSTWTDLQTHLHGAATATTTTLLAAIWPASHFVYDWRVRAAANGLRITAGLSPTLEITPQSSRTPQLEIDSYDEVREWVLKTADAVEHPVCMVERALYEVSRKVKTVPGRTWADYSNAIAVKMSELSVAILSGTAQI